MHTESSQTNRSGRPVVLAVGGGKGGVGKTVLAASIGMGLAMLHKDVVVADADFGGANLHRVFGNHQEKGSTRDFLNRTVHDFDDLMMSHPQYDNLKIVRSNHGALGSGSLSWGHKMKLIRHLGKLNCEYVVLDLGAGSDFNVLDLFLSADAGLVVVTPDPLSILDGYQFIKQAFLRRVERLFSKKDPVYETVQRFVTEHAAHHHANLEKLTAAVAERFPDDLHRIETLQRAFIPKLIVNRLRNREDEQHCLSIQAAAETLLSVHVDYWGSIQEDDTIRQALLAGQPFIAYDSKARASRDLATLVITRLMKPGGLHRVRARRRLQRKLRKTEEGVLICSVRCPYWEECELRNGGHPCELGGL